MLRTAITISSVQHPTFTWAITPTQTRQPRSLASVEAGMYVRVCTTRRPSSPGAASDPRGVALLMIHPTNKRSSWTSCNPYTFCCLTKPRRQRVIIHRRNLERQPRAWWHSENSKTLPDQGHVFYLFFLLPPVDRWSEASPVIKLSKQWGTGNPGKAIISKGTLSLSIVESIVQMSEYTQDIYPNDLFIGPCP